MRIVYQGTTLMHVCEIQYSRLMKSEPHNVERVLLEDDTHVTTIKATYEKARLKEKR